MKTLLALLLLIPSLSWGGVQIDFAGYKFEGNSGEYFELSRDGSLSGKVHIKIDNSFELKTLNGVWESFCWGDTSNTKNCSFNIFSGNLHCNYFVSKKSPDFFWFRLSERNFNNACFDTLMTREEFEIINLESVLDDNKSSGVEFREIEIK